MSTILQTDLRSRIVRATDTITIEHPVFLLVGLPGICKTSLAYSAKEPLLLDFDHGAYRAVNRRDTWPIETWADAEALTDHPEILAPFSTIVPDTVGRCLELLTAQIIDETPKYGREGSLTNQGWGVLKSRFKTWMTKLRTMGKDVLLIAHGKQEDDDGLTKIRADIQGGSYGELLKISDFVGTIYMRGQTRMLDFSPNEKWIGKNPGCWDPFKIPPPEKALDFMAQLFDAGRAALGKISDHSAILARQVDEWRTAIATMASAHEMNRALPDLAKAAPIVRSQVLVLLSQRAGTLGIPFDKQAKQFVQPVTAAPASDLAGAFA